MPRVTLENGSTHVQRGDDYEIGISQKFGSREYRVAAYNERVTNTSLMIANPEAGLFGGDLLPDLFSNSALFNAGTYDRTGYMASATQNLGDYYKITATWGSLGVIEAHPNGAIQTADDLRNAIGAANRQAVTAASFRYRTPCAHAIRYQLSVGGLPVGHAGPPVFHGFVTSRAGLQRDGASADSFVVRMARGSVRRGAQPARAGLFAPHHG